MRHESKQNFTHYFIGSDEPRKGWSIMAKKNLKKVTVNKKNNTKGGIVMRKEQEIIERYAALARTDETLMDEDIHSMMANELAQIKKEETTMKTQREILEELVTRVIEAERPQDAGYIKRDDLREVMNQEFEMGFNNRTTREHMVEVLMAMYKDQLRVDDEVAYGNVETEGVSVGDLEITKDNAPAQDTIKETPVANHNEARAKTDMLLGLLKKYAAYNESHNYGYTISSFMLQAVILEAGTGLKKFKGHKITEDELVLVKKVYKWLVAKEFIKPVVYSVKEDPNVRVYMPEYTGRTDSEKTKLVPYNQSAGYTANKVTSFVVTLR